MGETSSSFPRRSEADLLAALFEGNNLLRIGGFGHYVWVLWKHPLQIPNLLRHRETRVRKRPPQKLTTLRCF